MGQPQGLKAVPFWFVTGIIPSGRSQRTLTGRCTRRRQLGFIHIEVAVFPQGFVQISSGDPRKNPSPEFSGNYARLMVKSEQLVAALGPDRAKPVPAAAFLSPS